MFNYIKQDGWYYFVDLTKYRYRSYNSAVENGKLEDYYQTDYIAGNIHKAKSVKSYVNYIQSNYDEPPVLMVKYKATDAVDMDGYSDGNGGYIIYGSKSITTINVIYNDGTLKPIFVNKPNIIYDWSLFKSYQFK